MPAEYGYEGSGSRKMGEKKMSYGGGKLKAKAMKMGSMGGSMSYTTGNDASVGYAASKGGMMSYDEKGSTKKMSY